MMLGAYEAVKKSGRINEVKFSGGGGRRLSTGGSCHKLKVIRAAMKMLKPTVLIVNEMVAQRLTSPTV